jgi:hypothetical protein
MASFGFAVISSEEIEKINNYVAELLYIRFSTKAAPYEGKKWEKKSHSVSIKLKTGQLVISRADIIEDLKKSGLKISDNKFKYSVKHLEDLGLIQTEAIKKGNAFMGTLVTVNELLKISKQSSDYFFQTEHSEN